MDMRKKFDKKIFSEILKQIQKPGRYTGGEWNEIKKDPNLVKSKIALAFPDVYEVGMSHLGMKILYHLINRQDNLLAERVFAPWIDLEEKLREQNVPLCSMENHIPLYEFDILGFSLLYELNYSNILTILDLGGIPLLSEERGDEYPLIIGGGPAAFNPEPVADIFDLFLIGDGEEAFLEIIEVNSQIKGQSRDLPEILKKLCKIKGVYIPAFYQTYRPAESSLLAVKAKSGHIPPRIEKRLYFDFKPDDFPEKIIVPHIQVIFDRVAVEVARGCPQNCRFCQARTLYFPARDKEPGFVRDKLIKSMQFTGYEDVSLASLSIGDYPYLEEVTDGLMEALNRQKVALSLSSLRPEGLKPSLAEKIVQIRKTGFTLVPETGTERLRRVINKHLSDMDVWEAVETAFSHGWRKIKLYFMVGLPTETQEDLQGIVDMIKEIIRRGYQILKKSPQINLSVASFLPKAHTPFQWAPMVKKIELEKKHRFLRSSLKKYPFVKFKDHPLKNSILEAVFSRGDRRLTPVLLEAWKNGARFDSWQDQFDFEIWEKAFLKVGVDKDVYLSELKRNIVLPWEHIDPGIKKEHLLREWERALQEKPTSPCQPHLCRECAGCNSGYFREKTFSKNIAPLEIEMAFLGEKSTEVNRYRAFYTKTGTARFISQIDLNHLMQRGFRRAGIPVEFSQGFHPKMKITYAPALPLGVAGKNEVLEFKSQYDISCEEFLQHVNKFFPQGVGFLHLEQLAYLKPTLNEEIKTLVYSLELQNKIMSEALEAFRRQKEMSSAWDNYVLAEILVAERWPPMESSGNNQMKVDKEAKKVMLKLEYKDSKMLRPQEIIQNIFEMDSCAFLLTRERIILKKG